VGVAGVAQPVVVGVDIVLLAVAVDIARFQAHGAVGALDMADILEREVAQRKLPVGLGHGGVARVDKLGAVPQPVDQHIVEQPLGLGLADTLHRDAVVCAAVDDQIGGLVVDAAVGVDEAAVVVVGVAAVALRVGAAGQLVGVVHRYLANTSSAPGAGSA